MRCVYVCSPIRFSIPHNTETLKKYGEYVSKKHCIPIFPYKTENSSSLIFVSDELWVFGKTVTEEMKNEIRIAENLNISVRYIDGSEVDKIV